MLFKTYTHDYNSPEYIEAIKEFFRIIFREMDIDNSGFVTIDEFKHHLNALGIFDTKSIETAFSVIGNITNIIKKFLLIIIIIMFLFTQTQITTIDSQ